LPKSRQRNSLFSDSQQPEQQPRCVGFIVSALPLTLGHLGESTAALHEVIKQSAGDELLLAVRKVSQGASYLSPLFAKQTMTYLLDQEAISGKEKGITTRQSDTLQLFAEGMSMKE
jgi:hypothetical protein